MMHEKALGLLGISQKGGNIEIGEEPVGAVARAGKAGSSSLHPMRRGIRFAGRSPLQRSTIAQWR